jgi:hypothetical protein
MGNIFRTGSQLDLLASGIAWRMGQEPGAKGKVFARDKLLVRGVTRG